MTLEEMKTQLESLNILMDATISRMRRFESASDNEEYCDGFRNGVDVAIEFLEDEALWKIESLIETVTLAINEESRQRIDKPSPDQLSLFGD